MAHKHSVSPLRLLCDKCAHKDFPLNGQAGKCTECPRGRTSSKKHKLCNKCAKNTRCTCCAEAFDSGSTDSGTTGNYIIGLHKKPTAAQARILRLLGVDMSNSIGGDTFITKLTEAQVTNLRAESWVKYVEPERFSHTQEPAKPKLATRKKT